MRLPKVAIMLLIPLSLAGCTLHSRLKMEVVETNPIDQSGRAVVCFTEDGCEVCKSMQPIFDKLKADGCKFYVVDTCVEGNEKLAVDRGVKSFPTFVVYVDGKEHQRQSGKVDENTIRNWLAD